MFEKFISSELNGVEGVYEIDSGIKGPTIGICAITHGDEIAGLQIFDYLVNDFGIESKLKSGKLLLISVNIEAYKKSVRFIDFNMNRIYANLNGSFYEAKRVKQLEKVFDLCDILVDIHSVSIGHELIGVIDDQFIENSMRVLDVEKILTDDLSKQGAMISYHTSKGKLGYGIECGNQNDKQAFENGVRNILNLLKYEGMIDGNLEKKSKLQYKLRFIQEIVPNDSSFKYLDNSSSFQQIQPGETYAIQDGRLLINQTDSSIIVGFKSNKITVGDGCGFIFEMLE